MVSKGEQLLSALNVRVIGSGSGVIVMAHGFGSNQFLWESSLPSLETISKVVLFDWPGAGTTNADDFDFSVFESFSPLADTLLALLEVLGVDRCTYVGHSMSGMIGCIAAIKQPQIFDKLVLVGASPRYLNDTDYYGGFEQDDVDQILEAIRTDFRSWAAGFTPLIVGMDDKHAIYDFSKSLSGMRGDVAFALAKTIFESDYRDILPQVKVRVHILQTTNDHAVPMVVADYMRRNLGSKATVEVLRAEGHFPQSTAPDLFIDTLRRVLMTE